MRKKYYRADYSAEEKVIGVYPQCHKFVTKLTESREKKMDELYFLERDEDGKLPEETHRFDLYRLSGKKTNILSQINFFQPLMDQKALDLFLKFNLGEYQVIPSNILYRKNFVEYYFLFYFSRVTKFINFPKSEFKIIIPGVKNEDYPTVNSLDEFNEIQHRIKKKYTIAWLEPKKIVFTNKFPINLDLFRIPAIDYGMFFVSEDLKNAIEAESLTGLEFEENPIIEIEE